MERLHKDRESLVTDNLNLVHYLLKYKLHVPTTHPEYEDYFQEGCIGLILAAIRFDETKGFKFSTYASQLIIGTIQKYRREKGNTVRLPRDKYNLLMKVIQMNAQGYDWESIQTVTGFDTKEIFKCLELANLDSLDKRVLEDSYKDTSVYDVVENPRNSYEEILSEENIFECIPKVTKSLKSTLHKNIWEEYIWSLYYGERLNQQYFSMKYNCSQAHVSRILSTCKILFIKLLNSD